MVKGSLKIFHLDLVLINILGLCAANPLVDLALVSLILYQHKKGKRRKYLKKKKIPEEISHLQREGKPGKPAKEQNELGEVTGKPVL